LILFPIVMAALILLTIGFILLLRRRAAVREERSRIACSACQQPMYRSARACGHCGTPNPTPTELNWLGSSTQTPTGNRQKHPLRLAVHRRCRQCATRLTRRTPHQACPTCQTEPFSDPQFTV